MTQSKKTRANIYYHQLTTQLQNTNYKHKHTHKAFHHSSIHQFPTTRLEVFPPPLFYIVIISTTVFVLPTSAGGPISNSTPCFKSYLTQP